MCRRSRENRVDDLAGSVGLNYTMMQIQGLLIAGGSGEVYLLAEVIKVSLALAGRSIANQIRLDSVEDIGHEIVGKGFCFAAKFRST